MINIKLESPVVEKQAFAEGEKIEGVPEICEANLG
jgi:hypothetical protein